ncbi:hypothetical protein CQA44_12255, partial [Helicobacter sp. MIT 14-3879]
KNNFKINSPNPTNNNPLDKEKLLSQIDTTPTSLILVTSFKELREYYLTPTYYENKDSKDNLIISQSNFYNTYEEIDIALESINKSKNTLDTNNMESNVFLKDILDSIMLDYDIKHFSYRIFSIRIAYSIYEYILIIPKSIPSFIKNLLKEKRNKEELSYGYGRFINLQKDYLRNIDNTNNDSNTITTLNIQGSILLSPSGMEKVRM